MEAAYLFNPHISVIWVVKTNVRLCDKNPLWDTANQTIESIDRAGQELFAAQLYSPSSVGVTSADGEQINRQSDAGAKFGVIFRSEKYVSSYPDFLQDSPLTVSWTARMYTPSIILG